MGQETAKWALEVAAAGGHHLMMTGPPGTGKTMLASRIPGIMSPLSESEQLEVASIRSLCGTLPSYGISDVPPFEAPHHTASTASLVGGGADWLNQARSRGRIGASYSWTRRPNSRHAPCKPCANHWNPGMWRYPARKAPPTIRHDSN
ncbi:MAG: ATP-binding protein [Bifidobacterium sp.]